MSGWTWAVAFLVPVAVAPAAERLHYEADWRLMHAGDAVIEYLPGEARLSLKTVGFVGKLHRVDDHYSALFNEGFCTASTRLTAAEGSRQRETTVTFNRPPGKAVTVETNLTAGTASRKEIDIPTCVHDIMSALARLRAHRLSPGQSADYPVSDGRKSIQARITALARETVKTPAGEFSAIRHEASLLNGQLYRRKGRLYFWLSDDARRLPVRIKVELPFYVGSVTLELVKEEGS